MATPGRNARRRVSRLRSRAAAHPREPAAHPALAFTLVELLLVLAIMAILFTIAVPSFVGTLRGTRLRTAARSVVMAGRFARSMAVLRQNPMALTIDPAAATLSVRPTTIGDEDSIAAAEDEDETDDSPATDAGSGTVVGLATEDGADDTAGATTADADPGAELQRTLDHVSITGLAFGDSASSADAPLTVVYRSNGTCPPYTVELRDAEDEDGDTVVIRVDNLSSATTEGTLP